MNGWVKTYRKIQEHWIWTSKEPYDMRSAWQYLIMNANYTENKILTNNGELLEIGRGQILVSIRNLSEKWKWSVSKVSKFLKRLEDENMVKRIGNKNGTLLTIVNYGIYQDCENTKDTPNDTQKIHQRYTEQHMEDTPNDTQKIQDSVQNKEYKKEKEIKEDKNERIEDNAPPISTSHENGGADGEKTKGKRNAEEEKHRYGEYQHVLLTDRQIKKLFNDYGESEAKEAIKYLDEYIQMKGYKAKDHNLALRKWVFDAVEREKREKKSRSGCGDGNSGRQSQLDYLLQSIREAEQNE